MDVNKTPPFKAETVEDIKPGDRVRLTREFVVRKTTAAVIQMESGTALYFDHPAGNPSDWTVLERASEPFKVGEKITEAMGEPPFGSVIVDSDGFAWQRFTRGWKMAGGDGTDGSEQWYSGKFTDSTLLHLGPGA